jgi:hypothetical protein
MYLLQHWVSSVPFHSNGLNEIFSVQKYCFCPSGLFWEAFCQWHTGPLCCQRLLLSNTVKLLIHLRTWTNLGSYNQVPVLIIGGGQKRCSRHGWTLLFHQKKRFQHIWILYCVVVIFVGFCNA